MAESVASSTASSSSPESPPLRVAVLARDPSPHVRAGWEKIAAILRSQPGIEIALAAAMDEDGALDGAETDLVIVVGGDGAILRTCRSMGRRQRPILGVNLGRLGFLADMSPDEFERLFPRIRAREFQVVEHLMFEAAHRHGDGSAETFLGLNEVAVSAAGSLRMIDVKLAIDGVPVTTYSGDGLIVGTPVGSTAHSLSAGGPILKQELQAFVITPICPHTLTNRPLVDHADCVYSLTVPDVPEGAMMVIDGQIRRPIVEGDEIVVRRAPVTFQLARLPGHSYYATLHRKLGWGGQPRYQR